MSPSPAQPWWRRWFGSRSERAAAKFLKKLGYRILKRNYTCPLGELDIIALDGTTLVFVEVRSTEATTDEGPAHSVGHAKQQRLTRLALYFLQQKGLLTRQARFDVLTVSWPADQKVPMIHHWKTAFEATGDFQMFV